MSPVRVLVADDQVDIRDALGDLLSTDEMIEVVGMAGTAQEAISQCAVLRPDVVLMDVKMPGGGGATATRMIRQRRPETRIVALSAYQDRRTVLEMLTAGAMSFVTKGSQPSEILGAVHRAFEGRGLLSAGPSAEVVGELGARLRHEEQETVSRRAREERIRAAISGDLRVEFQPIVDLRSGRAVGAEALARFDGQPAHGPDFWFAEAAQLGLRLPLETAAFDAALEALETLPAGVFLSVNLSPQTLVEPGFWDRVPAAALERLVLELTEHAVVNDYAQLRQVLKPLRAQGARLAVDDAGAGFASLRHILLLEADFIKIDASITHDLHRHLARRALASALVTFAAETNATVIAEGIEQAGELDALTSLGAALGQGYLLGSPGSLDELSGAGGGVRGRAPAVVSAQTSRGRFPAESAVERMLRRLLRISSVDETVAALVGLVHDLGGRTVAEHLHDSDVIPVDLSLGVHAEPLFPAARLGTAARRALDWHLPACVKDARASLARLEESPRVRHAAATDPLTGLLDRPAAGSILRTSSTGDVFALLDLDHFRSFNDAHGREAGDAVLRDFAEYLRRTIRGDDACARFGGDVFLLVLAGTTVAMAVRVVERIAEQWRTEHDGRRPFSAGIAPVDDSGFEAALAAADVALQRAKSAGRGRIEATRSLVHVNGS